MNAGNTDLVNLVCVKLDSNWLEVLKCSEHFPTFWNFVNKRQY